MADRWDGCHPEGPDRLEIWADRNFSKHCQVLQLVRKGPTHQCIQGAMQTERRLVEMDLEVLTDPKLNRNQRGVLAVWNVTGVSAASEILPSKQGVPSPLLSTGEVSSDILHSARLPRRRLINYWRESRKGP